MAEELFSLGSLDETPEYEQTEEQLDEQEELHPEDVTDLEEESDSEEYSEDEELDEESEEESEVDDSDEISYTPFVEDLVEQGVLYIDENKEYDDSPEGFNQILLDTLEHRDAERIAALPEVLQQVFELAKLGEDPMEAFSNLNGFDYSQIDLEDESNQETLVRDLYSDRFPNWSEEKLERHIQNLKDLGELEGEAKDAQEFFIEKSEEDKQSYIERVREAEQERLAAQEAEMQAYQNLIEESEGFQGLKFTSNRDKEEFRAYCFDRGRDGLTQYERDTQKAEDKLTQAFYTYKKFGFESIARTERSKAAAEQKKVLKRFAASDKNASSKNVKGIEVERPTKGFKLGKI